jgi:hypothetical protein
LKERGRWAENINSRLEHLKERDRAVERPKAIAVVVPEKMVELS